MLSFPVTFANNPLDRLANQRGQAAWLQEQHTSLETLFVPFWRQNPLILPEINAGQGKDIGWLGFQAMEELMRGVQEKELVLLGKTARGKIAFAVDISHHQDPGNHPALKFSGQFEGVRDLAMAASLSNGDLAILAQAKALIYWHATHKFCACCGASTLFCDAGYKRVCSGCKAEHFPRTDPVVIMLATHGEDHCLLGRQKDWPAGMMSALAGFVEPGETLEGAVARELFEEAGLDIFEVTYQFCQPWPYPASLMIGCMAKAKSDKLTIDHTEISAADWFSRGQIQNMLAGKNKETVLPPPWAIARQLVEVFAKPR